MIRIILALTLTTPIGSPIPKHLFPPDPIRPGYRWCCYNYHVEVVSVKDDVVTFRSIQHPDATFQGDRGLKDNQMYRVTVLRVLKQCEQPLRYTDDGDPVWGQL